MLVDHRRKLALIAVPKTGSTSLHHGLMRALDRKFKFRASSPYLYHMPASDLRMLIGPGRFAKLHSVAVVRSPIDRAVSLFHDFSGRGMVKSDSFAAFANDELPALAERDVHFFPQTHFVTGPNGAKVIVSRVYRFEDGLRGALEEVCATIGVEPKHLGHARKSEREEAGSYYGDPAARRAVAEVYDKDFKAFDYDPEAAR